MFHCVVTCRLLRFCLVSFYLFFSPSIHSKMFSCFVLKLKLCSCLLELREHRNEKKNNNNKQLKILWSFAWKTSWVWVCRFLWTLSKIAMRCQSLHLQRFPCYLCFCFVALFSHILFSAENSPNPLMCNPRFEFISKKEV